jgi:nitrogen fixation/metabolism regulation signal transduction histidine kinase
MGLSKYKFLVIVRVILLLSNMIAISILAIHVQWVFSTSIFTVLLIFQIIDFLRFSFRIKKDLDNLITSIEFDDFSSKSRNIEFIPKFKESEEAFTRIKNIIRTSQTEKEIQYNFLNILIENIPSGIIVLKENKLFLANKSAKEILNLNNINSLEILSINYPEFSKAILNQSIVKSELIELNQNIKGIQLSYSITPLKLLKENIKIINFQNIKTTLDKNELLAWNKLIRTMTHEIMNSVTPIISLSEAGLQIINTNIENQTQINLTQKNIEHIQKSFQSIHNKSVWLNEFIGSYRKLIRIPQPKLSELYLNEFISEVTNGMLDVFENEKIIFRNESKNIKINADKNLIEHVAINLIKNAIESLEGTKNKEITIHTEQSKQYTYIHFTNNGNGIPEKILHQIFVPFFSTKENGSGIGLSIAKQIMNMHNGNIEVVSNNGNTRFTLIFITLV